VGKEIVKDGVGICLEGKETVKLKDGVDNDTQERTYNSTCIITSYIYNRESRSHRVNVGKMKNDHPTFSHKNAEKAHRQSAALSRRKGSDVLFKAFHVVNDG